jgi:hypothetical protein
MGAVLFALMWVLPMFKTGLGVTPFSFDVIWFAILHASTGTIKKKFVDATYSSLEHSGLGRYGDALNPWGTFLSLARAWCVTRTKSNGKLLLDVPSSDDKIWWNLHRYYRKYR